MCGIKMGEKWDECIVPGLAANRNPLRPYTPGSYLRGREGYVSPSLPTAQGGTHAWG